MSDAADFFEKLKGSKEALDAMKLRLMQRMVLTVEANAKRVTPVDTGTLRRSLYSKVETSERGLVGSNVMYARFVHDGTRKMAARPFLAQGLEASRDTIDQLMREAGEEFLKGLVP